MRAIAEKTIVTLRKINPTFVIKSESPKKSLKASREVNNSTGIVTQDDVHSHCPVCGKENPENFRFCPGCGGNLSSNHSEGSSIRTSNNQVELLNQVESIAMDKEQTDLKDNEVFCRNCGVSVLASIIKCENCKLPVKTGKNFCRLCGRDTSTAAGLCLQCSSKTATEVIGKVFGAYEGAGRQKGKSKSAVKLSSQKQNVTNDATVDEFEGVMGAQDAKCDTDDDLKAMIKKYTIISNIQKIAGVIGLLLVLSFIGNRFFYGKMMISSAKLLKLSEEQKRLAGSIAKRESVSGQLVIKGLFIGQQREQAVSTIKKLLTSLYSNQENFNITTRKGRGDVDVFECTGGALSIGIDDKTNRVNFIEFPFSCVDDFFNSHDLNQKDFAHSIINNYPLVEKLTPVFSTVQTWGSNFANITSYEYKSPYGWQIQIGPSKEIFITKITSQKDLSFD